MAISRTDIYDFLVDIVPREDGKPNQDDGNDTGLHNPSVSALGDTQTWPPQPTSVNGMVLSHQLPYQAQQQFLQMMQLQQLQQLQQNQHSGANPTSNLNQIQIQHQNQNASHTQLLMQLQQQQQQQQQQQSQQPQSLQYNNPTAQVLAHQTHNTDQPTVVSTTQDQRSSQLRQFQVLQQQLQQQLQERQQNRTTHSEVVQISDRESE